MKPNELVGRRIKKIRWMTEGELKSQGWRAQKVVVLELNDGTLIFGSSDAEGNAGGALFGHDKNGNFYVTVGK